MKKIFCDCCGKEFSYSDQAVKTSSQVFFVKSYAFKPHKAGHIAVEVYICIRPAEKKNGEHIDLCGDCRWNVINSIDPRNKTAAGTPISNIPGLDFTKGAGDYVGGPGLDPTFDRAGYVTVRGGVKEHHMFPSNPGLDLSGCDTPGGDDIA